MHSEPDRIIREFQANRLWMIAYIRSLVGDPDLTEDIFQELTVVVLTKAGQFDTSRDLQAWCRGIARNLIARERARARRWKPFPDDRISELIDTAFEENRRSEILEVKRSLLRQCLERLDPQALRLVNERYGSGLSQKQLAERLHRSEGAVQVALSRTRRWLLNCVQNQDLKGVEI